MPLSVVISIPIAVHHRSQVALFSACARVGFLAVRGIVLVARAMDEAFTALTYLTA